MSVPQALLIALAGFAAGLINALAGGGTLVSFPTLVALGVPAVNANVTNTVALVPGYLGGAFAQRRDLLSYANRLRALTVAAALGGLGGSILLVRSSEELFADLVPILILTACALLSAQDLVRRRVEAYRARSGRTADVAVPEAADDGATAPASVPAGDVAMGGLPTGEAPAGGGPAAVGSGGAPGGLALPLIVATVSVYGGYFGAGLGIMLLAVLGVVLDDPLPRINALKSTLSLVINVVAAGFFVFSGLVEWDAAAIMAVTSVLGGLAGGRIAGRLSARLMRRLVVTFGLVAAVRFWI